MTEPRYFQLADIDAAREAGVFDAATGERLKGFLAARAPVTLPRATGGMPLGPRFDLTHLLWYAGALITMGAMGLFSTLAFSLMGAPSLIATGLAYGLGLWALGHRLWQKEETRTPGGLLIAAAVAMVPLIVFGIQESAGIWGGDKSPGTYKSFFQYVKAGWLPMELATITVGLIAARRYPFTFIAFPVAVCLWFLSMDIAAWLAGETNFDWNLRRKVSLWFGIGLFVLTWIAELRPRKSDFAFWLHLVAIVTFWSGLTFQSSSSDLAKFAYFLINVLLLGIALFMNRRAYATFGVMGIMSYLSYLSWSVFQDSLLFPFALSGIGIAIVWLGIWFAKRRVELTARFEAMIPPALMGLRPYPARRPSA